MGQVLVKSFGLLERLAGRRETTVQVADGATVLDVLETLAERFGPRFAAAVFRAPREVHAHLRVFVNEEEASVSDPIVDNVHDPTTLEVLVLPAFDGGSR